MPAIRRPIRVSPTFERDFPGADAVSTACVLNLIQTAERLSDRVAVLAKEHGLPSPTALALLELVRAAGRPLSAYMIAERMFLHRATVTGLLDSLETRHFVARRRHPTDRRMLLVDLTPEGQRVLDAVMPLLHSAERTWLDSLSKKRQRLLLELLVRLQVGLEPLETAAGAAAGIP